MSENRTREEDTTRHMQSLHAEGSLGCSFVAGKAQNDRLKNSDKAHEHECEQAKTGLSCKLWRDYWILSKMMRRLTGKCPKESTIRGKQPSFN
eukprot:scaffold13527_cov202-Amphora_coffeaeformis.AAC.1